MHHIAVVWQNACRLRCFYRHIIGLHGVFRHDDTQGTIERVGLELERQRQLMDAQVGAVTDDNDRVQFRVVAEPRSQASVVEGTK